MRVLVAGGVGAVGKRLIPQLVHRGHEVVATTHREDAVRQLESMGVKGVLMDGLDEASVQRAVANAAPDVIVHQMTALGSVRSLRRFDQQFAQTNRLRTDGTRLLLNAAARHGVRRLVAQSFTGWTHARGPGWVRSEADPLEPHPPASMRETLEAVRTLERLVTSATGLEGVVLRYGYLYGPGTSLSRDGEYITVVQTRRFPVIGDGQSTWSFTHVDDAASAAVVAIEGGPSGVYHIVDDEPAPVSMWLPELARILGAPRPLRVPRWIASIVAGSAAVRLMTESRGASNAKAKTALRWTPTWSSWREGFRSGLG